MSFVKIFNIDVNFLRTAANKDGMNELSHEIERKLAGLDDMKGLPYDKPDIIRLIHSIEEDKIRFVQGDISAKRLYGDVAYSLRLFKIQHSEFDYLNDPAMNVYFS